MYTGGYIIMTLVILRLQLAALHFNENSGRDQALTKQGSKRFDVIFPKYKKGGYVVQKVLVNATYSKPIFLNHEPHASDIFNRLC